MRISDWSSDVCSSDLLFLGWQGAFGNARRSTWGARFIMVRLFSQWLHCLDTTHEVLPRGLVPYRYCRTHPYIFTPAEIVAIIEEAAQLPSIYGMRGLTCSTLFGLIAVRSEAHTSELQSLKRLSYAVSCL